MLNRLFEHVAIKELVLRNIHINPSCNLSKFLVDSKYLRKLVMAINEIPQIDQLLIALGANKSINSFELSCEGDYANLNLEPLRQNNEL